MVIVPPSPSTSRSSSPSGSEASEERASKKRRVEFEQAQAIAGPVVEAASLKFVPPKGLEKAVPEEALTEFSYEQVKRKLKEGCELWAIRLPAGLKTKNLGEAKLRKPGKNNATEKLGSLRAKKVDYDIFTLGDDEQDSVSVGASEMKGLIPLLANNKEQYSADALPISRQIVIRQNLSIPSLPASLYEEKDPAEEDDEAEEEQKHQQPEGLEGFFAPSGFYTDPDVSQANGFAQPPPSSQKKSLADTTLDDADTSMASPSKKQKKDKKDKKHREGRSEEKPKKKRKSEVGGDA